MMTSDRNIGLDLFRIIMMFGICLIHACSKGEYKCVTLHNVLTPSVVGFAMLSGYFGIRFTPSKIVRLYALAIGYCLLIPMLGGYSDNMGYMNSVIEVWGASRRYWYLHAYAALMCVAPALKTEKLNRLQPFFLVVFVWGFLLVYGCFKEYIPLASGLGSHTFVTLLGIYLFARVAKEQGWFDRIQIPQATGLLLISLIVFCLIPASGSFNSPIALMFIFSVFAIFKRIKSLGRFNVIVRMLAPSMFGVYLLHGAIVFPGVSTEYYGLIAFLERFHAAQGVSIYVSCFIVALEVFVISLAFDLIRRLLLIPVDGVLKMCLERVDALYEKIK